MKLARILVVITLAAAVSACAQPPKFLAYMYDSADRCQSQGQANYQYPAWCGASAGRTYIYTPGNIRVGYTAK